MRLIPAAAILAGLFVLAAPVQQASAYAPRTSSASATLKQDGGLLMARKGADDPANHNAGDRKRGRGKDDARGHAGLQNGSAPVQLARRGADDPANHNAGDRRRGRGRDDGPNHT
ncbi:MAG: hypothetical protein U1E45_00785 [Geminicoccaceae bacterium]